VRHLSSGPYAKRAAKQRHRTLAARKALRAAGANSATVTYRCRASRVLRRCASLRAAAYSEGEQRRGARASACLRGRRVNSNYNRGIRWRIAALYIPHASTTPACATYQRGACGVPTCVLSICAEMLSRGARTGRRRGKRRLRLAVGGVRGALSRMSERAVKIASLVSGARAAASRCAVSFLNSNSRFCACCWNGRRRRPFILSRRAGASRRMLSAWCICWCRAVCYLFCAGRPRSSVMGHQWPQHIITVL